jgi:hypothetical protein
MLGVSEKTTEGFVLPIFGMTNPALSGILGQVKSLVTRNGGVVRGAVHPSSLVICLALISSCVNGRNRLGAVGNCSPANE